MAKRRKPEVNERRKPDITVPSSITRSKPSNIQSVTTPTTRSKADRIQGLTAPTRSRSIGSIQPTASTTKPSRGFFSRNNSEDMSRSRPPVEAINGSTPRSKPSTSEAEPSVRDSIGKSRSIESPDVQESIGSTRTFPARRVITFSEL